MIKTVFLDLDDTLFDFKASEHVAICDTLRQFNIEPTENTVKRYSEINISCWQKMERGEWSRDEVLYKRFEMLLLELSVGANPHLMQSYYEKRLAEEVCYLDGAEELLEALQGKYRLYATSNGTAAVQDRRIELSGIGKYLDGIYISERVGYHKPAREFFDRIFEEIGGERYETVIVGDSLTSDIRGGIDAGIKTCLYNPRGITISADILPDYEIKSLGELPKLLEGI